GGERAPVVLVRRGRLAFLDVRALRQQVLGHLDDPEPEPTERDGQQDPLDLLLAPERVRDEKANRRDGGHAEGEAGPVRRLPLFAVVVHSSSVGAAAASGSDSFGRRRKLRLVLRRSAQPPPSRVTVGEAARTAGGSARTARGSIQRLTSMSAPNPIRIAIKPSVIGPTSPSEKPPGFSGFLRYST